MNKPLVSVIVTTFNNHATLNACLQSVKDQTYENIELVVVDNSSTDDTLDIAKQFTEHVYTKGPERCAQRNFAVQKSTGDYILIVDSDMELDSRVVEACVAKVIAEPAIKGLIIPEESFGEGFWAKCKQLERSFYVGVDWIEAARFFQREAFLAAGGYDEKLVSGEDWDLSQRVSIIAQIGRINVFIRHNEGRINLYKTLKKKSYYAQKFTSYTAKGAVQAISSQTRQPSSKHTGHNPYLIVLRRFGLYLSQPIKLFKNPFLGVGVLFMKVCEFGFGAFGYLVTRADKP